MSRTGSTPATTVAIIGTGFGGLGMAYYLKQAGIESFTLFEKAREIGGTWRENTYPGSGCDVPSHLYSFSFEPHYPWAWRYARQAQILDYMRHCADKHDLRRHIRLGCEVTGAEFDASRGLWSLQLADGQRHEATFLVSAVGQLHRPAYPKLAGLERFQGKAFHSAQWDHAHDLAGKTVAVIGTGASAVQFVPEIAQQARQLHVFQRSPGWTLPKAEREFSAFERRVLDRLPFLHDLDRARIYGMTELLAYAYRGHRWAEGAITALARSHLNRQVRDPELRRKLTPDHPVGCKRILLSNTWLPTLARPNVEVVTDAVTEITTNGIRSADGRVREVDTLIFGTGFAATDFLAPMQIRGLEGRKLRETWRHGAEAYLGLAVSGFPNFFMLYGPNTNVGSGSVIHMLECQQRYVTQMVRARAENGWSHVDVDAQAQATFNREVRTRSQQSTFEGNCQSWYKTADGRNTNNWIGSMREYTRRTARPVTEHFHFSDRVTSPMPTPVAVAIPQT